MKRKVQYIDKNIVDVSKRSTASTKAVRDFRTRLSLTGTPDNAYELEMLRAFAQSQSAAIYAFPVLVALIAIVASPWLGYALALGWAAITIAAHTCLAVISRKFLASDAEQTELPAWRKKIIAVQIIIAAAWVGFALLPCAECGGIEFAVIQFSAVLVLAAATSMTCYAFGRLSLLTIAPAIIALAGRFALTPETPQLIMGGILIGSIAFFYFINVRFRSSHIDLLTHATEKETLIVELETEKAFSEEARKRAEDANLAKSRFLATMSHELRTPLNAILGFSEMMRDEVLGPIDNDNYKDYVKDIHNSGSHLLKLINEILDISRIEAGKHELKEDKLSLVDVVEGARNMIEVKAKQKNVKLITHYDPKLSTIWIDERATRQIALNLMSNALKFTPSGGSITLKVGWTSKGGQYLAIKDTGPGIPEEEIPIVLSSFGQGSIAIQDAEQGTGLGLTIVQALLHLHQGRFDLKSKLREGTEVFAFFPKERVTVDENSINEQTTINPDTLVA